MQTKLQMDNQVFNTPQKAPRTRKEITMAITFRMPVWWVQKLDRIARELSLQCRKNIQRTDIIREIIWLEFIQNGKRTMSYRQYKEKQKRDDDFYEFIKIALGR